MDDFDRPGFCCACRAFLAATASLPVHKTIQLMFRTAVFPCAHLLRLDRQSRKWQAAAGLRFNFSILYRAWSGADLAPSFLFRL